MKYNLKSELPALLVALLPLIYLLLIWTSLPETVPIHWNLEGAADRMGPKAALLSIPFLLPILTYIIFIAAPFIDPKKKLQQMGDKLVKLKFAITFIMSVLALYIIHSAKIGELNPNFMTIIVGTLFAVLGNFFSTIKPNYFIGFRIAWTLNDDNNWKLTHRLAGRLWIFSGILIIIGSFIISPENNPLFFLALTALMVIIPIIYSFTIYRESKKVIEK